MTILFVVIYSADIFLLFFFGLHTILMVYLYKKNKDYCEADFSKAFSVDNPNLPIVTVQLPIYNEYYVVDRLVESVVSLKYPKDKLEIQVLDDSTDETVQKVARLVERYKQEGYQIEHLHRTNRIGHKAGALENGLQKAKGEFIAIFDADFCPEPDFLLVTLPYFDDPQIGMIQTRWGHLNQNYNTLTKAQAYGIDGHFIIEQVARNANGLWMNFNGTAGIWRRACIEDAGGWEHDTLTEDFDLSYRAELKGWKFRYFKNIVCKGEIPPIISAYKSQQFRWCKGSIQTAMKLLPRIWNANLNWKVKAEAIVHLINYSVSPLMVVNILLTAPVLLLEYWSNLKFKDLPTTILLGTAFFMSIGSLGPIIFYAYSQKELYPDWKKRIIYLPVLIMIGTGISVVNARAWVEAILGIPSGFKRTPKLRIESSKDSLKDRLKYHLPLDWHAVFEFFMGVYCFICIYLSFQVKKPFMVAFLVIYGLGFFFVAFNTVKEYLWKFQTLSQETEATEVA